MAENTNVTFPEDLQNNVTWLRMEDQLQWYSKQSRHDKKWYTRLRMSQLIMAAFIPVIALSGYDQSKWVTAIFGGLIAVFEGLQQLNQFGPHWLEYRTTAERLKREKYLFLSRSGHYRGADPEEALRLLAERVEENVSQENVRWSSESKRALEEKRASTEQKEEMAP